MRIIPLTSLAAAAALSVFASSVRAEVSNSPVGESPAPAVRSAGKQVLVGVLLPASGFHNLRGFPKFIVEIHVPPGQVGQRSEEHTSELQSHVNLVRRLLLEKKKMISNHPVTQPTTGFCRLCLKRQKRGRCRLF